MKSISVLIPIPRYGFDPTEVSIPWSYLKAKLKVTLQHPMQQGQLIFACSQVRFGGIEIDSMNDKNGRNAYQQLEQSVEFQHPIFINIFNSKIMMHYVYLEAMIKG